MNLTYSTEEFFYDTSFRDYPEMTQFVTSVEILEYELVRYFRDNITTNWHCNYNIRLQIYTLAHRRGFKIIKETFTFSHIIIQLCWFDKDGVVFYKFLDFDDEFLRTYQFRPLSLDHLL